VSYKDCPCHKPVPHTDNYFHGSEQILYQLMPYSGIQMIPGEEEPALLDCHDKHQKGKGGAELTRADWQPKLRENHNKLKVTTTTIMILI